MVGTDASVLEGAIESEAIATALATAALEKKGKDLTILDMRGLVSYTDLFVLVTASNRRQVRAIADALKVHAREELGLAADGTEGSEAGRWVLVDFGDVVVHIFDEPLRGFYDLDGLWRDAPRLDVPDVDVPESEEPVFSWPGA